MKNNVIKLIVYILIKLYQFDDNDYKNFINNYKLPNSVKHFVYNIIREDINEKYQDFKKIAINENFDILYDKKMEEICDMLEYNKFHINKEKQIFHCKRYKITLLNNIVDEFKIKNNSFTYRNLISIMVMIENNDTQISYKNGILYIKEI